MKKVLKITLLVIFLSGILISCTDASRKVDEKINNLMKKTESLDSLVNKEVDKVLTLDSLIEKEHQKVKKLDSIVQKSTSKLDSVVNKIIKPLK